MRLLILYINGCVAEKLLSELKPPLHLGMVESCHITKISETVLGHTLEYFQYMYFAGNEVI